MKRSKILLISALLAVFVGCNTKPEKGCSPAIEEKQIFRMNLHSEPSTLDPRLVRDIPTVTTGKMFFDGLMRINSQGKLSPSVASRYVVSEDKKTYTFYLRDTLWSNGMSVTAHDFEFAWKKVLSPDFPAEFAYQLFVLKNGEKVKKGELPLDKLGVRAEGSRKLIVELEHPDPYFLELTSFPICFPICLNVEKENAAWFSSQGDEFVCNGPFRLIKWTHGSELVAEKNPKYWDAHAVKLESVTLTMIEDEHTELNMYENDELDWAGSPNSSIPPEALPSLKSDLRKEELFILPVAGTFCYKFNTKVAPFDSLKMRQAFSAAINRESLVHNVLQANQLVASALLPPCMKQGNCAEMATLTEKEKAVALFEEALVERGWTRETLPEITLIFSKSEKHQKLAQAVQQEWNNTFDIKVNLQSYEWNTFLSHLSKGDYQVGGRGWISDLSDPRTLLEVYAATGEGTVALNNDTGWSNAKFNSLIAESKRTTDEKRRTELLMEAESILLSEMPIAPLYHSTACYLKKAYVRDVYLSKLCDIDLKHAYIQR